MKRKLSLVFRFQICLKPPKKVLTKKVKRNCYRKTKEKNKSKGSKKWNRNS